MTVVAALAHQGEQGVTLAAITAVVSRQGYASPRRIRAICDNFMRLGLARAGGLHLDRRERPLQFGYWFEDSLLGWLEIMSISLRPWMQQSPRVDRPTLLALVRRGADEIEQRDPFASWSDLRALLDRVAGYPILLEMIASSTVQGECFVPDISRKRLAHSYGVSRPHVAGLVAHCERVAWLQDIGGRLAFLPHAFRRLRFWIAREFAATKLTIESHPL